MLQLRGITVIGTTKIQQDAVAKFMESNADIVLLDANWNQFPLSGKDILQNLLSADKCCKVVMITTFYEAKIEEQFLSLHAQGYIYRNTTNMDDIVDCITSVYHSKTIKR